MDRRSFLEKAGGFTGMMLGGLSFNPAESWSRPSNLRITDIRGCTIASQYDYPIIKLYTNQDVYGWGEVRDHGHLCQALMLKPYLVGRDPLDIENIMESLRPFSDHGRYGGGFSAVDMALFDIAGKIMGWPAYKLLGPKRRDKIPVYADTDESDDIETYARRVKKRVVDNGLRHVKMDLRANLIRNIPGAVENGVPTWKGISHWGEYVAAAREAIGPDITMGADHFGRLSVEAAVNLGNFMSSPEYNLAYLEDCINYRARNTINLNRMITEGSATPTLNGEDIFGFEGFRPFVEHGAVDIIHPDIETSGGLRETKKICGYANLFGIRTMFHQAGSPIGAMAGIHCAATLNDFISMENHAMDIPWWSDLVSGIDKPMIVDGHYTVPETPGLGVELIEAVAKEYLREDKYLYKGGFFEPTPEFDEPVGWQEAINKKMIGEWYNHGGPWVHLDENGNLVNRADPR
ncbi:mandelate racemase/muconate lactonizing enzyme family protein [Candidatus Latescibacterota bacterium]